MLASYCSAVGLLHDRRNSNERLRVERSVSHIFFVCSKVDTESRSPTSLPVFALIACRPGLPLSWHRSHPAPWFLPERRPSHPPAASRWRRSRRSRPEASGKGSGCAQVRLQSEVEGSAFPPFSTNRRPSVGPWNRFPKRSVLFAFLLSTGPQPKILEIGALYPTLPTLPYPAGSWWPSLRHV